MNSRRATSGRTVAALILSGIGALLLAGGTLTFVVFPRLLDRERTRIEGLPHPDAVALSDTPRGREVIVEGRISVEQPVVFRDFVAYVRLEYKKRMSSENPTWQPTARLTPPLRIEMTEGVTHVVNASYAMPGPRSQWRDTSQIAETRYEGLVADEPVVILGKTTADGIEADIVTPGTRVSYLHAQATGRTVARRLGGGIGGVGTLLIVIAAALVLTGRSRA